MASRRSRSPATCFNATLAAAMAVREVPGCLAILAMPLYEVGAAMDAVLSRTVPPGSRDTRGCLPDAPRSPDLLGPRRRGAGRRLHGCHRGRRRPPDRSGHDLRRPRPTQRARHQQAAGLVRNHVVHDGLRAGRPSPGRDRLALRARRCRRIDRRRADARPCAAAGRLDRPALRAPRRGALFRALAALRRR